MDGVLDFLILDSVYKASTQRQWQAGDRYGPHHATPCVCVCAHAYVWYKSLNLHLYSIVWDFRARRSNGGHFPCKWTPDHKRCFTNLSTQTQTPVPSSGVSVASQKVAPLAGTIHPFLLEGSGAPLMGPTGAAPCANGNHSARISLTATGSAVKCSGTMGPRTCSAPGIWKPSRGRRECRKVKLGTRSSR